MIRIIILIVGLFLLWVLFLSSFSKQRKIVIGLCAACILAIGLWYESHGKTPKAGVVAISEVVNCGASAEHSYRSNYNVSVCLQNNSNSGTVQRLSLRISALDCENANCVEVDKIEKQVTLKIEPQKRLQTTLNLPFEKVSDIAGSGELNWSVEIISVRATH